MPRSRRPARFSSVIPSSSLNTSSLCWPNFGPVQRTSPGVSERRGTTFCIGNGPISGSSTLTIFCRAAYCSSESISSAGPVGDQCVQLFLVLAAGVVGCVPCALGPLGMAERFGEPSEDGVGVSADHDVVSVAGRVGVRRRHEGQDGPCATADMARERVLRNRALHES